MGAKMGPGYTNLFVGFIENKFFSNYRGPKPDPHKLYIDDCVGATSSSREHLYQNNNSVNSFNPALKYTWEISENSLAFLDLKLSINEFKRVYPQAYNTNQLILITIAYIHPLILNT